MKYLKPIFRKTRKPFKTVKIFLKQKAGWLGIPKIVPYRGFGNASEVFVTGRVMEDKGLSKPEPGQNKWQIFLATLKRFSGDEIAGVKVKATFQGQVLYAETDELGFFSFHFRIKGPGNEKSADWLPVYFELMDQVVENQPQTYAEGEVRIINNGQKRILVSDIDDTVLISYATQTIRKLKLMLFKNALTRKPFPGVASFYTALEKGGAGNSNYPFFYVSSSEWNLYDLLDDFFGHNNLPKGIFLLRKLNHSIYKFWKSGKGNHDHKYEKIKYLLEIYKNQEFILIGDAGQHDPEIYGRLVEEFPERIKIVFIRNVSNLKEQDWEQRINKYTSTDIYLVKDSEEAAIYAANKGYIEKESLIMINEGKFTDEIMAL
jgi:phosphatidate phosphatase APP1